MDKNTDFLESLLQQGVVVINECVTKALEKTFGKEAAERYENFADEVIKIKQSAEKDFRRILQWMVTENAKIAEAYKKEMNSFLASVQIHQKETLNSFIDGFTFKPGPDMVSDQIRKTGQAMKVFSGSFDQVFSMASVGNNLAFEKARVLKQTQEKITETLLATQDQIKGLAKAKVAQAAA